MPLDVFADMNPRQREAIAHREGPLLVVAGAGSGKTRVITHRIAHLIQQGVHPTEILAITFTNKAAGEMRERVERMLSLITPWICTFHSAALRLLKIEQDRLGFDHPFTVMDVDDQREYMKRVLRELGVDPKELRPRVVLEQVSRWKNRLLLPDEVDEPRAAADVFLPAYRAYHELARAECRVDFDDLLLLLVRLFDEHPDLAAGYREKFRYVLIDEYQDTNHAQYRMVRQLGGHGNVCATGDPDQAIYGWRGADIGNILSFERDFPGCRTVLLERNYRSTKHILAAAQGIIEHNVDRKEKTLYTNNPAGERARLITVDDQDDEAMAVAAACERLHAQGIPYRDIAIFYRVNAQSRVLEQWLVRRQLPYRIIGGTRFYDHAEIRDLLAYLNLLINPRDRVSFGRVVNRPRRGIGEKTLAKLHAAADEAGATLIDLLTEPDLLARVAIGRAARPLTELARLWAELRDVDRRDAGDCVARVLSLSRLEEHYAAQGELDERAWERVENLREMITAASQYHEADPAGGLAGFLDHVALMTAIDNKLAPGEDALVLMTLHASKGLEFPVVFVVGCEQGLLPLVRDPAAVDWEEERRLMYVGITRAQRELYLSHAALRLQFNRVRRNPPSMFLREIPAECLDRYDKRTGQAEAVADRYGAGPAWPAKGRQAKRGTTAADLKRRGLLTTGAALKKDGHLNDPDPDDPFVAGQRVEHSVFGPGTVRELLGTGEKRKIFVDFDHAGTKQMVLSYVVGKMRGI